MALYGYARVSTVDQDCTLQEQALRAAGCAIIRAEKVSASRREGRTELALLLEFLRPGDTLIVHCLKIRLFVGILVDNSPGVKRGSLSWVTGDDVPVKGRRTTMFSLPVVTWIGNAATVLSWATRTARGVEVSSTCMPSSCTPVLSVTTSWVRTTMWMLLATPSPINSGTTMILAKLNGRSRIAAAATVHSAATPSGASTRTTSASRRL